MSECSVKDCGKPVFGNGLCNMHYSRLRRHGNLDASRAKDWGRRSEHPLYNAWRELVRKKQKSRSAVWDDFWKFVSDVGERPSERHGLSRRDDTKPFGPDNFYWREKISVIEGGESRREYYARYQREYRLLHPERALKYEMKRRFGLPEGEYEAMLARQNGCCNICKKPETASGKGRPKNLAVDHCHATGKVRSLLCSACNTMIGQAKDDPSILRAAIEYLKHHSENTNEISQGEHQHAD